VKLAWLVALFLSGSADPVRAIEVETGVSMQDRIVSRTYDVPFRVIWPVGRSLSLSIEPSLYSFRGRPQDLGSETALDDVSASLQFGDTWWSLNKDLDLSLGTQLGNSPAYFEVTRSLDQTWEAWLTWELPFGPGKEGDEEETD